MLKITDFSKNFGDKIAVKNLNLHINKGELFGFIGHNGAGKTTTIKACCGLLPFEKGEILIDGISIKENPVECKRNIAYIPDNPDLYDFMNGVEFLDFVADIFKVPDAKRKDCIEKYGTLFDIKDSLNKNIATYSHGMKQKLAIMAALIHEPKLLIMDEPFVGLDPLASHNVKEIMKDFCNNGGSIFFSTHVLEVAEKLCSNIAIIKNGELIKCGSIQAVRGDSSLEDVFLELTDENNA